MEKEKKIKYGAMWSRMSENKKKYYKISIDTKKIMDENGNIPEVIKIIAFINFYKEDGSKQPDYILYKDDSKEYNINDRISETTQKLICEVEGKRIQRELAAKDNGIPF